MSVYNGAAHLEGTLESILGQRDVELELVVVDDGSTDGTAEILRRHAERDSRIRVLWQENRGLTRALIRGCGEARGDYIARHDAGDVSDSRRLRLQKDALDRDPELVFVSSWTEFCGPEMEFLYLQKGSGFAKRPVRIISEGAESGLADSPTSHGSVMFRRQAYVQVGGYREAFYCSQDWDLWYRLAEVGSFEMLEQPLHRVRLVPESISGRHRELQLRYRRLSLHAFKERLRGRSDAAVVAEAASVESATHGPSGHSVEARWLYFIGECLRRNRDPRARLYLRRSISSAPVQLRAWVRLLQATLSDFSR
jgi:glycosyltransferase involved in cell wall biosynthesis